MPKYILEVTRTMYGTEQATVEVEARNEEQAIDRVWEEDIYWEAGNDGCDYEDHEVQACKCISGSEPIKGVKPVSSDVQDKANQLLAKLKGKGKENGF